MLHVMCHVAGAHLVPQCPGTENSIAKHLLSIRWAVRGWSMNRDSRYFGRLLRNKSATGRADSKGESTSIGQTKRRLPG